LSKVLIFQKYIKLKNR